jgi:hypothetical protein
MPPDPAPPAIPEPRRNALLRQVDWRFLLRGREAPRAVELAPGWDSEALRLVSGTARPGEADLAVAGFPSGAALHSAREALAPGGEFVCGGRLRGAAGRGRPRPRLEKAGFTGVRTYWAGPLPHCQPQFWLPLESSAAVAHLLATRPARSPGGAALRWIWRLAARAGVLSPLYAIARAPGGAALSSPERVAEGPGAELSPTSSLLLLTGGHRSVNKVVGLAIEEGRGEPAQAVKFARVPEAEPGLAREAAVLGRLGDEHPGLAGVPALRGQWRRGGRLAVAESAIGGDPMLSVLTPDNFGELSKRVTSLLIELARRGGPGAGSDWRTRLVEQPLQDFERSFGPALGPEVTTSARRILEGLEDMPSTCEHRDCSPWNVVLTADGTPALLDWESAEPDGLPGLDLVYFLANCAFVLDHAIEAGRTRESYARLLDPATANGRVATAAIEEYSAAVGTDADAFRRLRLLCWIVHSRSDYRHLELEVAGTPEREALRGAMFVGLVEEELRRDQLG